jgi:Uncharacterized conserved protein
LIIDILGDQMRSEIPLDIALNMLVYSTQERVHGTICRPDCFVVEEEVDGKPVTQWIPKHGRKFAYILEKKGLEHFSIMNIIRKRFNISISYLGIKDTRAITRQLVLTSRFIGKEIAINQNAKLTFIGNASRPEHTGNRFKITIHGEGLEKINDIMNELNEKGFPNYYGYQRFGTIRPNTHLIGFYLVKEDYCKAFREILSDPYLKESKEILRLRAISTLGSLDVWRKINLYETEAVNIVNESQCIDFFLIRKDLSLIFIDAYLSFFVNKLISENWEKGDVDTEVNAKIELPNILSKTLKRRTISLIRKVREKPRNASVNVHEARRVTIEFSLPRGSYATMVLREIFKDDPRLFT